ncbi:MAG TPA: GNAT family N-acetyltransferase [Acidimicrobiia bacterium]|nr:GNAT family N-acetyltransferase [Acidimicrobiia bacterium]
MPTLLATERMTLRPITMEDVDVLVALDSDPEVMRFISGGKPSTRAETERIVQRSLGHRWLGFERESGKFVGWFGIRPSTATSRELGYRLRREAWGQGLATEGARAVIAVAFAQPGVDRVRAETMAVNTASRAVMERCGLRFVRAFRLESDEPITGTELGEVEYEITKSEWESDESRMTTLGVVTSDKDPASKPQTPAPKSDGPKEVEDAAEQEIEYPEDETNEG